MYNAKHKSMVRRQEATLKKNNSLKLPFVFVAYFLTLHWYTLTDRNHIEIVLCGPMSPAALVLLSLQQWQNISGIKIL